MCAVDGKANYLVCPTSCDSDVAFEDCSCKVNALVSGTYELYIYIYIIFFLFNSYIFALFFTIHTVVRIHFHCSCFSHCLFNFFWFLGNTTWQNLFPCLLNSKANQDFFLNSMPEEMISDLVFMAATASVQEVGNLMMFYSLLKNCSEAISSSAI